MGEARGSAEVRARIVGFAELFPDGGFTLTDDLLVDGDRVAARWEGGGTHTGAAWELPIDVLPEASGRTMDYTGTTVYHVRDGTVTAEFGQADYLRAMRQLGLVEPTIE